MVKRTNHTFPLWMCTALLVWLPQGCGNGQGTPDAGHDAGRDAVCDAGSDAAVDAGADAGGDFARDAGTQGCEGVTCPPCAFYVDLEAAGAGDGTTPQTAFARIQAGIDAAAAAAGACCTCEVRVAEGSYFVYRNDSRDTVRLMPGVHLRGGYPAGFGGEPDPEEYLTVLDGWREGEDTGAHAVFHVVTGADRAVLEGFVVRHGNARQDQETFNPHNYGGGLYCVAAGLRAEQCVFSENQAVSGAGIYAFDSRVELTGCRFESNAAEVRGGGIDTIQGTLAASGCTFSGNTAEHGAGLYNLSTTHLSNCSLETNLAGSEGGGISSRGELTFDAGRFTDNVAKEGGGLYNLGTPLVLTGATFTGNQADSLGGGLVQARGSLSLAGCTFEDNTAVSGGAVYHHDGAGADDTAVRLRHVRFLRNQAQEGGGVYLNEGEPATGISIENCVFSGNITDGYGGGLSHRGTGRARVINCVFYRNEASLGGGIHNGTTTIMSVHNNIFQENTPREYTGPIECWHSVVQEHGDTSRFNIGGDPNFIDASNDDFRLWPFSICVDRGDNTVVPADLSAGLHGGPRIADGDLDGIATVDMGIEETNPAPRDPGEVPTLFVDADATGNGDGSSWDDAFTSLSSCLNHIYDEVWFEDCPPFQIFIAKGIYLPDSSHGRESSFGVQRMALYGGFDPSDGAVSPNDRDPQAYPTVLSGDLENNDDEGIVSDNTYHVVMNVGSTVIDGLTITAGHADGTSWAQDTGGGMLSLGFSGSGLGLVRNCRFEDNHASYAGGGLFVDITQDKDHFIDCSFSGNRAGSGGGMCIEASFSTIRGCRFEANSATDFHGGALYLLGFRIEPRLLDSTFRDNTANGRGGAIFSETYDGIGDELSRLALNNCAFSNNSAGQEGGAIYGQESGLRMTNCTLAANASATDGGGLATDRSSATAVWNSILWNNTAPGGSTAEQQILVEEGGLIEVSCSDVQGGIVGQGNLGADPADDPLFVQPDDDLHLQAGSPCIDAADDARATRTDAEGRERYNRADMGAYEWRP